MGGEGGGTGKYRGAGVGERVAMYEGAAGAGGATAGGA